MQYKAIVSDIDGTLINDNHELSQENYQAIQELIANGYHFILSSGRPDAGMRKVVEECGLVDKKGFIIAFNGGKIIRTDTGEVLFSEGISHRALNFFSEYVEENDLSIYSYTADKIVANCHSDGTELEATITQMECAVVDNFSSFFEGKFIPKAIISSDATTVKETLDVLKPFEEEQEVELAISNPIFLEVTGKGINKGKTLHRLAYLLDINISEIIAIGDGGNDLIMIQEAGLGIAVANASDELKAAADEFTVSNNEHAIAAVVKKYF